MIKSRGSGSIRALHVALCPQGDHSAFSQRPKDIVPLCEVAFYALRTQQKIRPKETSVYEAS